MNLVNNGDQNCLLLDDQSSVMSDNVAWSNEVINNSDSDLESNSPSKYTPYSTVSSYSGTGIGNSNHHSNIDSSSFDLTMPITPLTTMTNSANSNAAIASVTHSDLSLNLNVFFFLKLN
jgi:hypothetical protein